MIFGGNHQRPPWASVNLGRKVASELGAHGTSVSMRAGHLKEDKWGKGPIEILFSASSLVLSVNLTLPQIHLMFDFSACPGTEVLFLAL